MCQTLSVTEMLNKLGYKTDLMDSSSKSSGSGFPPDAAETALFACRPGSLCLRKIHSINLGSL